MNFREHNPPHFHAYFKGTEMAMCFDGTILIGSLPSAQERIAAEWARDHAEALLERWNLAMSGHNFPYID